MRILALNAGSSSLKFRLFEDEKEIAHGLFEKIGYDSINHFIGKEEIKDNNRLKNHHEAIVYLMRLLKKNNLDDFDAIGHRVVHGGSKYQQAVIINKTVISDIDRFSQLAPLHNPANLMVIKLCQKLFPNLKMVAVFDTAFHQTITKEHYLYAVPKHYYEKHQIRRYGFHGISHQYLSEEARKKTKEKKLITCHLGNGCSVTAIKDSKSVATSMGFTPNSGLIMGTRSGDIEAMIIPYLLEYYSLEEINSDLNKKSGLLGLSEKSNDLRDIENNLENEKCALAYQKLINSIVSYIAQYYVLLEGVDAIVFSGGIGENSSLLRKTVIEKLKILNIELDLEKNKKHDFLISSSNSKTKCYIIKTNEELMIARMTKKLL